MSFIVWTDPYAGLAASIVTSNVLDATDAFDISLSWHTASGTSSVFTYQVSGKSTKPTTFEPFPTEGRPRLFVLVVPGI